MVTGKSLLGQGHLPAIDRVSEGADGDGSHPSIQSIDGASSRADLPTEYDQNCESDQRASDYDGGTQDYCLWCGGLLTEEVREAANQMREQLQEPARRWRAGDLSVRGVGRSARHPAKAKRLGPVAQLPAEAPDRQPLAENSPNPAVADGTPAAGNVK